MDHAPTVAPMDVLPVPASEWPALHRALGSRLLARLLDISMVSLRRYQSGEFLRQEEITDPEAGVRT